MTTPEPAQSSAAPGRRAPRSLQQRLVRLTLAWVALVWLLVTVSIWRDAQHELDELLDGHLAQSASLLRVQVLHGDALEEDEEGSNDAPLLHRYAPRVAFQVFIGDRLALHSANVGEQPLSRVRDGFSTVQAGAGEAWRVFATRDAARGITIFVGERTGARRAILMAVLRSSLWPMALALPLLGLAVWWATRRGLQPLQQLSQTLAQRTPQALQPLPTQDAQGTPLPAELQPLVESLNALLQRIAELLESERRFTADAAHELRTPIAAIRTQAQVALGATDDTERRHALQSTLAGCDRATRLVEQLLTLARLEAQGAWEPPNTAATGAAQPGGVDLHALAQRVLAELAPAALGRAQELALEAPPEPLGPVPGDEVLLGVLLRNLVDNALRYSPDGAQVRVVLGRDAAVPGAVCVDIHDSGPGLNPQQQAQLGERFFRVLGSGASGSGLGWSIVRRVAQVLGVQVTTSRSEVLGGLCVHVRLDQSLGHC